MRCNKTFSSKVDNSQFGREKITTNLILTDYIKYNTININITGTERVVVCHGWIHGELRLGLEVFCVEMFRSN